MNALTKRGKPRQRVGPNASVAERLALHTEVLPNGCVVWTAAIDQNGYGRLQMGGKLLYAHRVAYTHDVGPIAAGLEIDHLCRNRACCNPMHLEAVTATVNVRRGTSPGAIAQRRHSCVHGHPYPQFAVYNDGRRRCRVCRIVSARLWRATPSRVRAQRKAAGLPVVDLAAYFAANPDVSTFLPPVNEAA